MNGRLLSLEGSEQGTGHTHQEIYTYTYIYIYTYTYSILWPASLVKLVKGLNHALQGVDGAVDDCSEHSVADGRHLHHKTGVAGGVEHQHLVLLEDAVDSHGLLCDGGLFGALEGNVESTGWRWSVSMLGGEERRGEERKGRTHTHTHLHLVVAHGSDLSRTVSLVGLYWLLYLLWWCCSVLQCW